MSKKPLVSVIMPVYNAEKFIDQAIESILCQTFKDFELIIINDASTDKCAHIIKNYQKKDKRIKVIKNERNLQVAESLNKGVHLASSDLIARMDADDISFPDRLYLQYSFMVKNPRVAILGANIIIIDEHGNPISKREYPERSADLKSIMFRYSPFAHPVVMFRKKAFEEFGGYDVAKVPCEDIDLWFKLGSKYEFATVPKFIMRYRIIKNSNSNKKLRALEMLGFKIKLDAIKRYGYTPNLLDIAYNLGQFLTLWFMPSSVRVWAYNFLRSQRII